MPVLLLGTSLFALVQLLLILATPLAPSFEAVTPTSDDVPFVALAELYNGLTLAVAALGLGFIARGPLAGPPVRGPDGRLDRLGRAAWRRPSPRCSGSWAPPGSSSAPRCRRSCRSTSARASCSASCAWRPGRTCWPARCAARSRARSRARGWRLAAAGAGIVLFALALVNLVGLVTVPEAWIVDAYQWTVVIAYALGHLCLLVAFTLGLPSLDPVDDDDIDADDTEYDEDNDDGFEEFEDDYEEDPDYDAETR